MRILIISFSPLARDPRVLRQVRALRDRHQLVIAGFDPLPGPGLDVVSIGKRRTTTLWKVIAFLTLFFGLFRLYYWVQLEFPRRALHQLGKRQFDLVLANDVNTLPLAFRLAAGVPVYLDAHEYAPAQFSSLAWRLSIGRINHWICRRWLTQVKMMSTVCEGLSRLYGRAYGRSADCIVFNVPPLQSIEAPGLDPQAMRHHIRLVHHGSAEPERRLEVMVGMLDLLDQRFSLDLYMVGSDSQYARSLTHHCRDHSRLRLHAPVPMDELPQALSQFDIGLYLLPPDTLNLQHALPNKLFEFLHAGLAIAIGPSPEMAAIVQADAVGVVAPSFDPAALAACLNGLEPEQICQMRRNAWSARERYTSQLAEDLIATSVESAVASNRP
jgi:glycosyltransferase involved in cell wall biosynthesis